VGAEYLTAEGGKHEDRKGTRERGRRGMLGDEVEGMIAVRGRAGKGEREKLRFGNALSAIPRSALE